MQDKGNEERNRKKESDREQNRKNRGKFHFLRPYFYGQVLDKTRNYKFPDKSFESYSNKKSIEN